MNTRTLPRLSKTLEWARRLSGKGALRVLPALLLSSAALWAQSADAADPRNVQKLLQRIEELEARVARLEAAQTPVSVSAQRVASESPAPAPVAGRAAGMPAACNGIGPQQQQA